MASLRTSSTAEFMSVSLKWAAGGLLEELERLTSKGSSEELLIE